MTPELAESFEELSVTLGRASRWHDALAPAMRAVEQWRRLVAAGARTHEASLSRSLSRLGETLLALNRRDEALAAAEEALAIVRTLASERPQHHLPGLATRLVGHSRILERMGRVEEAIDHGVEATEVFRRLAADRPEAFLPDLARALSALSAAQAAAGRREEALATVEEAIGIRVGLAAGATPWAHLEWIESLESRSELLAAQGRFEDALELQRRVLEERRGPAHGESQEVQRARLAYSLTRLARSLAVLGQDEGALSAGEEAVALYRDLAAAEPIAHTNSLSHALTDLGAQLVSSGRVAEAEAASQEALALLNSRGGQVHLSDRAGLARALGNLGMVHLERGEISRALEVQREVVAGYRHLAQAIPEIYTAELGLALHRTAATLRNLGRDPEAIESVREALELLEPRSLAAPAVYGAEVAELRSLERELESAEALRKQEREKEKKQSNEDPAPSGSTDDILRVAFRRWVPELSPPSALLRPEYGVVPFHGREQELESLLRWARSADRFAVTLLTGPGGMGKTRLAQEVGLVLSKEGWVAGFLPEQTPVNPEELWTALGWPVGRILLIVDYAEIRRQRLVPLLRFLLTVRTGPVRLLLLARAAHDWWDQLKAEGDGVGELLSGPATTRRPLQPVAASAVDRERSYLLAAQAFAKKLGTNVPEEPPGSLHAPCFEHVLLIHMGALVAAESVEVKGEDGLLDNVLAKEQRYWQRTATARGIPAPVQEGIGRAMSVFTLRGGASSEEDAIQVLAQLGFFAGQPTATLAMVVRVLHELYSGDRWIEPLQPDLLAEHLVLRELERGAEDILDLALEPREAP